MNPPNDELDLLRQLRSLPREREPARDLWPDIQARLAPAASKRRLRSRNVARWLLAAGVALALLAALPPALQRQQDAVIDRSAQVDGAGLRDALIRREAQAMSDEYRIALAALEPRTLPADLLLASDQLDASAEQLLDALREQPDASFLLNRLRNTYDRRLKLARLAAAQAPSSTLDGHG
jgi:hypothetical protein